MGRTGLVSRIGRRAWRYLIGLEDLLFLPEAHFRLAETYLARYHQHLLRRDWAARDETPHWYNHRIDLFTWSRHRNGHWVERGVYSTQVMWPGCVVLDIGCGDGFYPYHFYTHVAASIDAVDSDAEAIAHNRAVHAHPKINSVRLNVVTEAFPRDRYDVVTWDGGLGHLSRSQIEIVAHKIADALQDTGVLCGYEELQFEGERSWDHHIAIGTREELKALLAPFFRHVLVLESRSPGRRNAYFRCSQNLERLKAFQ